MGEDSNCRQVVAGERKAAHLVVAGERKAAHLVVAEEHTADRVCRVEDSAGQERTAEGSAGQEGACTAGQVVAEERKTGPAVAEERTADRVCTVEDSAEEAAYKVDLAEQAEQAEQVDLAGAHRADYRQDRQEQGYTERTWAEGSSTSEQGSTEEGARTNATTPLIQSWAGKAEPCRGTSGRWDPRRRKKRTDRT